MMMTLFDEEQILKNHDAAIRREATEKATKVATEKANEQAILNLVMVYRQTNAPMNDVIKNIMKMYNHYSEKDIKALVQKYWDETPVTINLQINR